MVEPGARLPTYLDRTIAGVGQDVLSGSNVVYARITLSDMGLDSRVIRLDVPDHRLRIGWIAFGDPLSVGADTFDHWRSPIYLDFQRNLWSPNPSASAGATLFTLTASIVRWALNDGASGELFVFGL